MITAFPKIFAVGTLYTKDLFKDEVEITEKIDGSQFVFGKTNGAFYMRSKGREIFPESVDAMFETACDYVMSIQDLIPDNTIYYCEYLQKLKHNTLKYGRVPENNLILYGVSDGRDTFISEYDKLKEYAEEIDIEVVPLIFKGKIDDPTKLLELLERKSVLGEADIEGIVVKNYKQIILVGGQPMPMTMGKFVSEKFKEVHQKNWGRENTGKGKWVTFVESYRTEARWEKAVQHLKEKGELEGEPRDIGKLIKEVTVDIIEEEKENIKDFLWREFGKEVLRKAGAGLPEWYKEKLLTDSFKEEK